MKIFLDTADLSEIRRAADANLIDGGAIGVGVTSVGVISSAAAGGEVAQGGLEILERRHEGWTCVFRWAVV